jgi:hypothetical protein
MASSVFPDYKYFNLIHGRHVRRDRTLNLRSACLRPISQTFFENVARIDSFSVFPAVVAAESLQKQLLRDCATFKVTGALSWKREKPFSKKTETAIRREMQKLSKSEYRRVMSGKTPIHDKVKVGADHINGMLSHELGTNQAIEAILFSVVLAVWTAFETLAADLWYVALDYGPGEWRTRVLSKSSNFKKRDNLDNEGVDLSKAADPQKQYGSALRDTDRISFQKLRYIKFWYKTVLGQGVDKIFKEAPLIQALFAVRNVINHKAGIADNTYLKAVASFPELNTIKLGQLIQLDGEVAREMENAALLIGGNLVLLIDEILTPKP